MKSLLLAGFLILTPSQAFAQTSSSTIPSPRSADFVEENLASPTGHDVSAGLASYTYREPGEQAISIHGVKFVGEYTGTLSLNTRQHWFLQGQLRSTLGSATYEGWCSPFLITPSNASPNGYRWISAMRRRAPRTATTIGTLKRVPWSERT